MEKELKSDFVAKFRDRTKKFVVGNIKLYRILPKTEEARVVGKQLLRSSSSVGSNYRAACRARCQAEFHLKISILVENSPEPVFWMEVLMEANVVKPTEVSTLMKEGTEILKVLSSARKTIAEKNNKK